MHFFSIADKLPPPTQRSMAELPFHCPPPWWFNVAVRRIKCVHCHPHRITRHVSTHLWFGKFI